MSIRIREDHCVGCRKCTVVCPGSLISMKTRSDGKRVADIAVPEDCWGCVSCVKECAFEAIDFFLGEDIAGKEGIGTTMRVKREGALLHWNFYKDDELLRTITVDSRNSNNY